VERHVGDVLGALAVRVMYPLRSRDDVMFAASDLSGFLICCCQLLRRLHPETAAYAAALLDQLLQSGRVGDVETMVTRGGVAEAIVFNGKKAEDKDVLDWVSLVVTLLEVGDSSVKDALVQADVHEMLLNDYLARRQELITTGVRGDLIKKGCLRAIKKMTGMDLTLMLRGGDAAAADDDNEESEEDDTDDEDGGGGQDDSPMMMETPGDSDDFVTPRQSPTA